MSKVIEQSLEYCDICNKSTVHMRNARKVNWLMQLVLVLFTAGLWFVVILFWILIKGVSSPLPGTSGGSKNPWICSSCGGSDGKPQVSTQQRAKQRQEDEDNTIMGYLVIAGVIVLGYLLLKLL